MSASSNLAKQSRKISADAKQGHIEVLVANHTDTPIPRVPFKRIAEHIFTPPYTLSIAAVPSRRAQVLNATYRDKSYSPNVLSFSLSSHEGEIILNLAEARRQYDAGYAEGTWVSWVALLVIHSMLHLNGMHHGRTMERRLEKVLQAFGFDVRLHEPHTHVQTHHHRH